MMIRLSLPSAACLGLLLGALGCGDGGGHDGGMSMSMPAGSPPTMASQLRTFDGHVTGVEAELAAHQASVTASASVASLAPEEDAHLSAATRHADGMGGAMGHMMTMCGQRGSGGAPDTAEASQAVEQMRQECDDHRRLMSTAADMTAARAEEDRHQRAMTDIMGRMRTTSGRMMGMSGDYDCSMSDGSMMGGSMMGGM